MHGYRVEVLHPTNVRRVLPIETKQFSRPRWSVATIPGSSIFMNYIWRAVTLWEPENVRGLLDTSPTPYCSATLSHAMKSHAWRILSVRKFRRELGQFSDSLGYDSFTTKRVTQTGLFKEQVKIKHACINRECQSLSRRGEGSFYVLYLWYQKFMLCNTFLSVDFYTEVRVDIIWKLLNLISTQ